MSRWMILALAILAAAGSPAVAQGGGKAKTSWVEPGAAFEVAGATGKPICWIFMTGAEGTGPNGSRAGCGG